MEEQLLIHILRSLRIISRQHAADIAQGARESTHQLGQRNRRLFLGPTTVLVLQILKGQVRECRCWVFGVWHGRVTKRQGGETGTSCGPPSNDCILERRLEGSISRKKTSALGMENYVRLTTAVDPVGIEQAKRL
jgi:hypothetical protein